MEEQHDVRSLALAGALNEIARLREECERLQRVESIAEHKDKTIMDYAARIPALEVCCGNLLDHWDGVPNDIKTDPGIEIFAGKVNALRTALGGE